MPSSRRVRIVVVAVIIVICTVYYLSSDSSSQQFYDRTVAALDKKDATDREVAQKLHEVKDAAKEQRPVGGSSPQKPIAGDTKPSAVNAPTYTILTDGRSSATEAGGDVTKSVAGRKTMKGGETKDLHTGKEAPMKANKKIKEVDEAEGTEVVVESKEDHEIERELNSILKKGPIIIFSKSYCPHSARAKRILLEKYTIVPAPYVVELDNHPLGQGLQDALEKSTGRRTVPNVLINGRSIGGGDDVQALDDSNGLIDKVKGMGGKRITQAKLSGPTE